jgi:putative oxidoreductase
MHANTVAARWIAAAPKFLSVLRIVAALLFIQVGTMKMLGWPIPMPGGMEFEVFSLVGFAGVLEVFGGILMLLGLFTRPVAFILAGEMAFAYFMGHAAGGLYPIMNGGTDAVLYCFLWLYYSAAGAGPWSVDAYRRKF